MLFILKEFLLLYGDILKNNNCQLVDLLFMGELYDRVRKIQHQGFLPPSFVRLDNNVPCYGVTNGCPTDCENLHHENLCNNKRAVENFLMDNYLVRCTYIPLKP